jgi:hypothetical protein
VATRNTPKAGTRHRALAPPRSPLRSTAVPLCAAVRAYRGGPATFGLSAAPLGSPPPPRGAPALAASPHTVVLAGLPTVPPCARAPTEVAAVPAVNGWGIPSRRRHDPLSLSPGYKTATVPPSCAHIKRRSLSPTAPPLAPPRQPRCYSSCHHHHPTAPTLSLGSSIPPCAACCSDRAALSPELRRPRLPPRNLAGATTTPTPVVIEP